MSWDLYYDIFYKKPASELLKMAIKNNSYKLGIAYDLGCGTGSDTKLLLDKKWNVTSIDREKLAKDIIKKRFGRFNNFNFDQLDFKDIKLTSCELINGTYSYPFVGEKYFNSMWEKMVRALNVGGTISGQLFGTQDGWNKTERVKTLTEYEFIKLIKGFDVLYFDESKFRKPTALGNVKDWHVYSFVIQKVL